MDSEDLLVEDSEVGEDSGDEAVDSEVEAGSYLEVEEGGECFAAFAVL